MRSEIEIKFFNIDKAEIRNKLKSLGAELRFKERLYKRAMFQRHDNPNLKCNFLRIRNEQDQIRLSAKISAIETMRMEDQKELDVIVSNFEDTIEILKVAGLKLSGIQESKRESWIYRTGEIDIDTWPFLLPCLEIEADSSNLVKEISRELGFDFSKGQIGGYGYLYKKIYGLESIDDVKLIDNLSFNMKCPFKNSPDFSVFN